MAVAATAGVALAVMLWSRTERDFNAETAKAPAEAPAEAPGGNASPTSRDPGVNNNRTVPPPATATTSAAVAEPSPELDHHTLWRLCPSLWGEPSNDCMAALDDRFADRAVWLRHGPHMPFPSRTTITWRQVHADPTATRRIVAEALRNPECLVADGQVRLDLREVCAADALTKLAILQQQCGQILRSPSATESTTRWVREQVLSRLENDKSLDFDEYHRRRTQEDEGGFWGAWQGWKCSAAEPNVTAWLPQFPTPPPKVSARSITFDQGVDLILAAARLGSEWALARTLHHHVAHINAMAELDLALAYAGRAKKVGRKSDLYLPYFIAAEYHARQRGVPPHEMSLPIDGFSKEQWQAAVPKALRIIAQGWEPMVDH